jgi:hypothetical protein
MEDSSMKRLLILTMFLASPALLPAAGAQTMDATVCEILANPASFNGKTVRIKGTVIAGFDEFVIKDSSCNQPVNAIWLAYPAGTKAKAGPVAFVQLQLAKNNPSALNNQIRAEAKLDKNNKDFKQFDSLLSTPAKVSGMCLGCARYSVTATLVGRLDGTKDATLVRDASGKVISADGFGNMNRYAARLVLESVADVSPQEIDYSKAGSAKDDVPRESSGGDPVAGAHQIARALGPGSPAGEQVEKAAAAFGKEGEDNGVEVGFGVANEIPMGDGTKGSKNSPDGLLFNSMFDVGRLKGNALSIAISHVGAHIADLRDPQPSAGMSPYEAEYRAWQVTVLCALGSRQNLLTLPGGFVAWNASWPAADRNALVDGGITKYLTDWDALKNQARQ